VCAGDEVRARHDDALDRSTSGQRDARKKSTMHDGS
jgi:hypothetical protein